MRVRCYHTTFTMQTRASKTHGVRLELPLNDMFALQRAAFKRVLPLLLLHRFPLQLVGRYMWAEPILTSQQFDIEFDRISSKCFQTELDTSVGRDGRRSACLSQLHLCLSEAIPQPLDLCTSIC